MKKVIITSSILLEQILDQMDVQYEIDTSRHGDSLINDLPPEEHVKNLSFEKAKHIADNNPEAIAIAEESVVYIRAESSESTDNDNGWGKSNLSGNYYNVYTGITVIENSGDETNTIIEKSRVYFKELPLAEIQKNNESDLNSSGSSDTFSGRKILIPFNKINRDLFNTIDLPVFSLKQKLKDFNFVINSRYENMYTDRNSTDKHNSKFDQSDTRIRFGYNRSERSNEFIKDKNHHSDDHFIRTDNQNRRETVRDESRKEAYTNTKDNRYDQDSNSRNERSASQQSLKTETQQDSKDEDNNTERRQGGILGYLTTTDVIVLFIITAIAGIFAFGLIFSQLGLLSFLGY